MAQRTTGCKWGGGELSVKRGDVGGKEEVVERSEEEVECEGEFLVVCVGELRGDVMGGEEAVERLQILWGKEGGRGRRGGLGGWEVWKELEKEWRNLRAWGLRCCVCICKEREGWRCLVEVRARGLVLLTNFSRGPRL